MTPMEIKTIPESVVFKLYQLKKRVKELDPSWEFNDPYNHYIFRILILLDALEVDEIFSLEKHGKICDATSIRIAIDAENFFASLSIYKLGLCWKHSAHTMTFQNRWTILYTA